MMVANDFVEIFRFYCDACNDMRCLAVSSVYRNNELSVPQYLARSGGRMRSVLSQIEGRKKNAKCVLQVCLKVRGKKMIWCSRHSHVWAHSFVGVCNTPPAVKTKSALKTVGRGVLSDTHARTVEA